MKVAKKEETRFGDLNKMILLLIRDLHRNLFLLKEKKISEQHSNEHLPMEKEYYLAREKEYYLAREKNYYLAREKGILFSQGKGILFS